MLSSFTVSVDCLADRTVKLSQPGNLAVVHTHNNKAPNHNASKNAATVVRCAASSKTFDGDQPLEATLVVDVRAAETMSILFSHIAPAMPKHYRPPPQPINHIKCRKATHKQNQQTLAHWKPHFNIRSFRLLPHTDPVQAGYEYTLNCCLHYTTASSRPERMPKLSGTSKTWTATHHQSRSSAAWGPESAP